MEARKALIRGLVDSLVEHGRIRTTLPKAKELRRFVEKAITIGKQGDVACRRVLEAKYPNKNTVKTVVDDLSVRFKERPGGYTRIIKAGNRPGDMAPMALIEFVDYELPEVPDEATKAKEQQLLDKLVEKRQAAKRKTKRNIQNNSRKINR